MFFMHVPGGAIGFQPAPSLSFHLAMDNASYNCSRIKIVPLRIIWDVLEE
jgi:hypothetical protein